MVRSERRATVLCLLIAVLFVFQATTVKAEEVAGKGEWQSLSSEAIRGTWSAALERSGTSIKGTLTLAGSNVFTGGQVTGTVDASSIALGVVSEGEKHASFSGKLDGDVITGEWESAAVGDHGVWYGTLEKR